MDKKHNSYEKVMIIQHSHLCCLVSPDTDNPFYNFCKKYMVATNKNIFIGVIPSGWISK